MGGWRNFVIANVKDSSVSIVSLFRSLVRVAFVYFSIALITSSAYVFKLAGGLVY